MFINVDLCELGCHPLLILKYVDCCGGGMGNGLTLFWNGMLEAELLSLQDWSVNCI